MRIKDSAGKESGESNKGSRASQYDAATPRTAPAQEMTMASTSNWRTMRQRLAPIARADGELMLARAPAGQQKDGAVGAADDEQKHNGREQKREGAAQVPAGRAR